MENILHIADVRSAGQLHRFFSYAKDIPAAIDKARRLRLYGAPPDAHYVGAYLEAGNNITSLFGEAYPVVRIVSVYRW